MPAERVHYREIDALKGLAMFLVILGHAIVYYPVNLHKDPVCLRLFRLVSSVDVLLFFLLAGLLFSCRGGFAAHIGKKLRRLGVPFLIFNLLDMLPRAFLPALFHRPRSIQESLLSMLLNGGELWFLRALLLFYALCFPLVLLQRRGPGWKLAVELGLFVLAAVPLRRTAWVRTLDLDRLRLCLLFFNTGHLLRDRYPAIRDRLLRAPALPTCLAATALTALWVLSVLFDWIPARSGQAQAILSGLLGIAAFTLYAHRPSFLTCFARFGPWTLQLYLMNSWTMGASRYFICVLLGVTSPAVIVVFNLAVDFFLSYLLIKYVLARSRVLRFAMGISSNAQPALTSGAASG